jgi:hypothetical protein
MLRLGKPKLRRVDLGGSAWIEARPATQFDLDQVHGDVSRALAGIVAGSEAADFLAGVLGEDFNVDALKDRDRLLAASIRLSEIYLVMACQSGWSGIVTEDGQLLDVPQPASVALLLSDPAVRTRVMAVVNARIHVEQAEGNVWPASPNGEAGAPDTAPPAGPVTSPAPAV